MTVDNPTKPVHKILVVDDDLFVLRLLEEVLRRQQYYVVAVHSGEIALKCIEASINHPFDLAIIDFILPEIEGLTLVKKLSEMFPATKILMISGHPISAGYALGQFNLRLLQKPFTNAQLISEVQSLLCLI